MHGMTKEQHKDKDNTHLSGGMTRRGASHQIDTTQHKTIKYHNTQPTGTSYTVGTITSNIFKKGPRVGYLAIGVYPGGMLLTSAIFIIMAGRNAGVRART